MAGYVEPSARSVQSYKLHHLVKVKVDRGDTEQVLQILGGLREVVRKWGFITVEVEVDDE